MMVVPAESDPLFSRSTHPEHMKPEASRSWEVAVALPASAGEVLMWRPNTIHWGEACTGEGGLPPRKSIAMEFSLEEEGEATLLQVKSCYKLKVASYKFSLEEEGGEGKLRAAELQPGRPSLGRRVRLIAQALLTYL